MTFLTVQNVGKRFGTNPVLHDVSFAVPRGTVATLLGPSGCGKTTMLRAIAGLETIDAGSITLQDRTLATPRTAIPPEKRGIGMVFQSYALWPHKTVTGNVTLGLRLRGTPRAAAEATAARMLALVGLPGLGSRYPGALSGGQQQRVSLARALALEPQCLLFDEPLSNLDLVLRERMRFEIRAILVQAGITAIYVTHDQSEAMVISDQLLIMHRGRIVQAGAPGDVYRRPATRFVAEFLGRANLLPLDPTRSDPASGHYVSGALHLRGTPGPPGSPGSPASLLAFRPESVALSDAPEALDAIVESSAFLGGTTQCQLRLAGTAITAALPGFRPLAPGQPVRIAIDPDGVTGVAESEGAV